MSIYFNDIFHNKLTDLLPLKRTFTITDSFRLTEIQQRTENDNKHKICTKYIYILLNGYIEHITIVYILYTGKI